MLSGAIGGRGPGHIADVVHIPGQLSGFSLSSALNSATMRQYLKLQKMKCKHTRHTINVY